MANSNRGVMKLSAENLDSYKAITTPPATETAGVSYQTIKDLEGVQHLEKFDDSKALILAGTAASLELKTIALP
jgi:hypothetical protein